MGLLKRFGDNLRYAVMKKHIKETDITHYGFIEELNERDRTVRFRFMDIKNDETQIFQIRVKEIDSKWRPLILTPVLVTFDNRTGYIDFEKPIPSNSIEEALIRDVERWIREFAREKRKESPFNEEWLNIRTQVLKRDHYRCVNCGQTGTDLHVHHVVPKSKGGTEELDNLVTLCAKCHSIQEGKGHELINSRLEGEDYDAYADEMDEEN